jgi:hypothetical protein
MEPSPPHILRVPAEILSSILSLAVVSIVPSGSRYLPNAFELTLAESPFHCVRSTCRTFRQIVDQLPFWKKDEFSIAEIEEFRREERTLIFDKSIVARPDGTDVLLSDPHLQQCLLRKTGWVVESPRIFDILALKIPGFGQHVLYLELSLSNVQFPWACITDVLRDAFPTLQGLHVYSTDHVHLTSLPQTLRKLTITEPLTTDCHYNNNLPVLDEFKYSTNDAHLTEAPGPSIFERILPFSSKSTIERLEVDFNMKYEPTNDAAQFFSLIHNSVI